jgi:S-DNA-T family DNA segregation ATPase FtsK/SpoIIIE
MPDPARNYCLMLQASLMHVLSTYGVYAQPGIVERHPKTVRLFVLPAAGTKHQAVLGLHREIVAGLGLKCTIMSDERGLYVDALLPAGYWRTLSFAGLLRKALAIAEGNRRLTVPALLGLDEDGRIVLADLASAATPHILLAGTTGSGKTNLLLGIVLSLAAMSRPPQIQLFILDAKGYSFPVARALPHVRAVAVSPDDWLAHAAYVVMRMEERLEQQERFDGTHLVLVIDELADVLLTDEQRTGGALAAALVRLTQKGREVGVHLIAATQKPSAKVVSSLVTSNLPCRLVGQVVSGTDAALATGQRASDAHLLPGKGSFMVIAGGRMDRITAPLVRDSDVERVRAMSREGPPAEAEAEGVPRGKTISARAFLDKFRGQRKAPGRPAQPPRPEEVQALVDYCHTNGQWPPSRREVQRIVGQATGGQIANARRAEAALAEARMRVDAADLRQRTK